MRDVIVKQDIPVMAIPIKKKSILNCLLIGKRGFVYKMICRKLPGLFEEGKRKQAVK